MDTKQLITMGILSGIAYVVMLVIHIKLVPSLDFLTYDPKDVVIAMGGFLFGPLPVFLMSFVVSFFEMITISSTGVIGMVMNMVSTCAFAGTAALIYKRQKTLKGAVFALAAGVVMTTAVMLAWNYFLTPLYMGIPREAIVPLLLPAFLPFNLLKGGLNAGLTVLIYKPLVNALRNASLLPRSEQAEQQSGKINIGAVVGAVVALGVCIAIVFLLN
jgi:riboflavin transporter FmnP